MKKGFVRGLILILTAVGWCACQAQTDPQQVEQDIDIIIRGNFSPDALGPEVHAAVIARVRARAADYLTIFASNYVSNRFDPVTYADLYLPSFLELLREQQPQQVRTLAALLQRRFETTLLIYDRAVDRQQLLRALPDEAARLVERLDARRNELRILAGGAVKSPLAAVQIGGISTDQGRVWISGIVLRGAISDGDSLEAVGLATAPCTIDEVRVAGNRRQATEGENCQMSLHEPGTSFTRNATQTYLALVAPNSTTNGTQMRAELRWLASKQESLTTDTRVELRFSDIKVSATLKKPDVVTPAGGTNEWNLILDQPLPIIPRFGFSMNLGGKFAAMGKVLGVSKDSQTSETGQPSPRK